LSDESVIFCPIYSVIYMYNGQTYAHLIESFDVLTSIVSLLRAPSTKKGVAYGVTSGPLNRNTVTKASRRGVAT
jgi:hypothetical protein